MEFLTLTDVLFNDDDFMQFLEFNFNLSNEEIKSIIKQSQWMLFNTCSFAKTLNMLTEEVDDCKRALDGKVPFYNRFWTTETAKVLINSVKQEIELFFQTMRVNKYSTVSELLTSNMEMVDSVANLENISSSNVIEFINTNVEKLLQIVFEKYLKYSPHLIADGYDMTEGLNFIHNGIVFLYKGENKKLIEDFTNKIWEFLMERKEFNYKKLDRRMLYNYTTNEYQNTIEWCRACKINYATTENPENGTSIIRLIANRGGLLHVNNQPVFIFDKAKNILVDIVPGRTYDN